MNFIEFCSRIEAEQKLNATQKLKALAYLEKQQVLRSRDINDDALQDLTIFLKQEGADANYVIDAWITRHFDQGELRALHGAAPSLNRLIQDEDTRWKHAWGSDSDFQYVLPLEEKHYVEGSVYVACPSVSIVAADTTIELNGSAFQNQLEDQCNKYSDRTVLLIPLNDRRSHWLLGQVTIENNRVVAGMLWNSMSGADVAKQCFTEVLSKLNCGEDAIKYEGACEQQDVFRCFDYVCQKILRILGKNDHPIVQAQDGAELRRAVGQTIADALKCGLPLTEPTTPLAEHFSKLKIQDPKVLVAYEAFIAALKGHNPELGDSEVLVIERGVNSLTLSSSSKKAKAEHSAIAAASPSSPLPSVSLEEKFEEAALSAGASIGEEKKAESASTTDSSAVAVKKEELDAGAILRTKKIEDSFRLHYDDSSGSDEEDGEKVDPRINLEQFKANVIDGQRFYSYIGNDPQAYWYQRYRRISFYLFVLGMMLIRSAAVNGSYRSYKRNHLMLSEGELDYFKKKVLEAFQEQFGKGSVKLIDFETKTWPIFLNAFRVHAKQRKIQQNVLLGAVKAALNHLFPLQQKDIEVMVGGLIAKIGPYLPKRATGFNGRFDINNQENADHQIMAIIKFLSRVTRRHAKSLTVKDSYEVPVSFYNTTMVDKVGLGIENTQATRGQFTRTDYIKISQPSSYPDILDSKDKNGTRRSASITKYTFPIMQRTGHILARDMRTVSHGFSGDNEPYETYGFKDYKSYESYIKFLRKVYYMLQRAEGGRNPGALIINMILLLLISSGKCQWSDVLPANEVQQNMMAAHPGLIHPMTLDGSTQAAAVLLNEFNALVPEPLKYDPHQETIANDPRAATIAAKQYAIVNRWFWEETGRTLEQATDEEIIERLCQTANDYYFPKR